MSFIDHIRHNSTLLLLIFRDLFIHYWRCTRGCTKWNFEKEMYIPFCIGYLIFWRYKYVSHKIQKVSILLLYKTDPYITSIIIITFFIQALKCFRLATRKVKRNTTPKCDERASRRATPMTHDTLQFLIYRKSGLNMLTRITRSGLGNFNRLAVFSLSLSFVPHALHVSSFLMWYLTTLSVAKIMRRQW